MTTDKRKGSRTDSKPVNLDAVYRLCEAAQRNAISDETKREFKGLLDDITKMGVEKTSSPESPRPVTISSAEFKDIVARLSTKQLAFLATNLIEREVTRAKLRSETPEIDPKQLDLVVALVKETRRWIGSGAVKWKPLLDL